jgi:hypothetical protein
MHPLLHPFLNALNTPSDFVRALNTPALDKHSLQPLSSDHITQLIAQGNRCADWSALRVVPDFECRFVQGCEFVGSCELGRFDGTPVEIDKEISLPNGLYRSTIAHSSIGSGALVREVGLLWQMSVGAQAVVNQCTQLSFAPLSRCGLTLDIQVGNECGGRSVQCVAEMPYELAALLATHPADNALMEAWRSLSHRYLDMAEIDKGFIGHNCRVVGTPVLRNVCLGPGARIEHAASLEECCVVSSRQEPVFIGGGARVRQVIVQWGAEVDTAALVEQTLLCEHSHATRHVKLSNTIIGPNTGLAEGEVTSSLVGPFVGFHHQALLIATLWPQGKGNIGYGANVGSNHTGKAPDQELYCGEGLFFGLGTNIKFPSNFTEAPYSLVATGVDCAPQRLRMPFSLITNGSPEATRELGAVNEVFPGWVLAHNQYMLKRNEHKFASRNKARRTAIQTAILRPDSISLLLAARRALQGVAVVQPWYHSQELEGIGSNVLSERSRQKAIETYTFFITYYALNGLADRALGLGGIASVHTLCQEPSTEPVWEQQRQILWSEGVAEQGFCANLQQLIAMEQQILESLIGAKGRDHERGAAIMDDYQAAHTALDQDSVVKLARSQSAARITELVGLMERLQTEAPS